MGEGNEMTNDDTSGLSKAEIQRELEAKREKISHTVDEIRYTLSDEVRERKQKMREAVDWHTYVDKNPAACLAGAAAVGFFVGRALGSKMFNHEPEPTWRDSAEEYRGRAGDYYDDAEAKVNEWRGRARGQSKWRARSRSAMSSGTDMVMREILKTAQRMILPTIIAAITGKAASDNKTTVVEKEVHKTPGTGPDVELTKNVTEFEDGEAKTDRRDDLAI